MTLLLDGILVLVFLLVFFFIPGDFFLSTFKTKLTGIQNLATSCVLGIALFSIVLILSIPFGINYRILAFAFGLTSLHVLFKYRKGLRRKLQLTKEAFVFFILAILIALLSGMMLFRSGREEFGGLAFYVGTHDPMHHLSLIAEMRNNFPPQNPSFSGEPLKNYHYFADLIIAFVLETIPLDVFDLYFRIFPFFNSLLFSLSTYALVSELTVKKWARLCSLILVTLGGSVSYLLPLFIGIGKHWSTSTFMIDQPFGKILNPQTFIGYSFFLIGSFLLLRYIKENRIVLMLVAGALFALAFNFSVYAAIIGVGSLSAFALYRFFFLKDQKIILGVLVSIAIIAISYATVVSSYKNGLFFVPGWGLAMLFESPDRLNLADWKLKIEHYKAVGNYARVFQYYAQETLIYVFGNLGVRAIGLFYLFFLLFRGSLRQNSPTVFFMSGAAFSLIVTLLFNQGGSPFDIFQFGQFALIINAIFTVLALEKISVSFSLRKSWVVLITLFVVILSLPTFVKSFPDGIYNRLAVVSDDFLASFQFMREKTDVNSVFLVYPVDDFSRYVTGLGQRRLYVSDLGTANYAKGDRYERVRINLEFIELYDDKERLAFLAKNNIDYLYIFRNKEGSLTELEKNGYLQKVYADGRPVIYKVL